MPSSFLRRHVRTLLRGKFSPTTSLEENSIEEVEATTPSNEAPSFLAQCYLTGIDGRRIDFPEVYCGKTGLEIPNIQLEAFDPEVFATFTGPDGGLTKVGSVRQKPLVRIANLDDEMSISMDGTTDEEVSDEDDVDLPLSAPLRTQKENNRSELLLGSCSSLIGPNCQHFDVDSGCSADMTLQNAPDSPAHYPMNNSYRQVVEKLLKDEEKKEKKLQKKKPTKPKKVKSPPTDIVTDLPTLCSPIQPQPGDIVMRHKMTDGGRLIKVKRGAHETRYHLKIPDGRQIYLEKRINSLALVITDCQGRALHVLGCEST